MDNLPLPSLQVYTVFSSLGLFYAVAYSLTASVNSLWNDTWCATVSNSAIIIIINPLPILTPGCGQLPLLHVLSIDEFSTRNSFWKSS